MAEIIRSDNSTCGLARVRETGEVLMPNWCENEIVIAGDPKSLDHVIGMIKTDKSAFDFSAVIPCPEEFTHSNEGTYRNGDQASADDWRLLNWGTKHNNQKDVGISLTDGELEIFFLTAWSPSLPVTIALAKLFPELFFTHLYEEGSNDFSGQLECKDGEVLSNIEGKFGEYRLHEDEYYDEIDDDHEEENENQGV